MQPGAARGGSFFDNGTYGKRAPPPEPRDPVKVRKDLRQGALGAFGLAAGLIGLAIWNFDLQRRGLAGEKSFSILLFIPGAIGLAGLGVGLWFSFQGWMELPPRSLRSTLPGWFSMLHILGLFLLGGLVELEIIAAFSFESGSAIILGGLAIYFVLAAWAVLALAWRLRVLVALAFALGGALFAPIGLAWAGVLVLPPTLVIAGTIAATALLVFALVAYGLATLRTARNATDSQLA